MNDTKLLVPLVYENSISRKSIPAVLNWKKLGVLFLSLISNPIMCLIFDNGTHKCKFIVPNHIGCIMIDTWCRLEFVLSRPFWLNNFIINVLSFYCRREVRRTVLVLLSNTSTCPLDVDRQVVYRYSTTFTWWLQR